MTKRRIIIENRSDLPDVEALHLVQKVIKLGRISRAEKQYSYVTTFGSAELGDFAVVTDLNKASDRFVVINYGPKSHEE